MHRLGEVGEEGLDGAGGVGDLFGEEFQPHDLAGLRGRRAGQFARSGEVAGQSGVDQVRGDQQQTTPTSLRRMRFRPGDRRAHKRPGSLGTSGKTHVLTGVGSAMAGRLRTRGSRCTRAPSNLVRRGSHDSRRARRSRPVPPAAASTDLHERAPAPRPGDRALGPAVRRGRRRRSAGQPGRPALGTAACLAPGRSHTRCGAAMATTPPTGRRTATGGVRGLDHAPRPSRALPGEGSGSQRRKGSTATAPTRLDTQLIYHGTAASALSLTPGPRVLGSSAVRAPPTARNRPPAARPP
ncbi:hypothetical protein SALBM311S_11085 [Streptomyces alboniger]